MQCSKRCGARSTSGSHGRHGHSHAPRSFCRENHQYNIQGCMEIISPPVANIGISQGMDRRESMRRRTPFSRSAATDTSASQVENLGTASTRRRPGHPDAGRATRTVGPAHPTTRRPGAAIAHPRVVGVASPDCTTQPPDSAREAHHQISPWECN